MTIDLAEAIIGTTVVTLVPVFWRIVMPWLARNLILDPLREQQIEVLKAELPTLLATELKRQNAGSTIYDMVMATLDEIAPERIPDEVRAAKEAH